MADAGEVRAWRGEAPEVSVRRILKVHGYRDLERVRRPIMKAAETAAVAARQVAEPQAVWTRCAVARIEDGALGLEGGVRFTGATFARTLGAVRHVAPFALTLGPAYDSAIAARMADEPVEALFLDTAGWLSVERATRDLARHIDAALGPGLRTSIRLGPGYDYRGEDGRQSWPLEEQRELFGLFGGGELPVTLLESCAMTPKMSRSGLFGLIETDQESQNEREGASAR